VPEEKQVTICPCCGFKFQGALSQGCAVCGARPVGEPLPRPENELPSYGRSLLIVVTGLLMVLVFLTQTILALVKRPPVSLDLWSWIAAAETAAWRLKWVAIPATIVVLWGSRKIYRSMLRTPSRFCGLGYARCGLMASALVTMLIAVLIGVTVPERLRRRQRGIEAGIQALGYTYDRALFEYREKYGKLPGELKDLRDLPDPDGSIAAALNNFKPEWFATAYKPTADLAATQKPVTLRGTVIRNASLSNAPEETLGEGLSFTNYTLRLPGEDNLMGTEDDWIVRDGLITRVAPPVRRAVNPTASTVKGNP
jgi:hypothetical protein